MMKKIWQTAFQGLLMIGIGFTALPAMGADYSAMRNDDLAAHWKTMNLATEEERDAFRAEWRLRFGKVSREEQVDRIDPLFSTRQDKYDHLYDNGNSSRNLKRGDKSAK